MTLTGAALLTLMRWKGNPNTSVVRRSVLHTARTVIPGEQQNAVEFLAPTEAQEVTLHCQSIFSSKNTPSCCRVVSAVYEMLGATGHIGKTQELFSKLDANSDGSISKEEFVAVIKQDKSLLDVLQGKQALVWMSEQKKACPESPCLNVSKMYYLSWMF